MGREEGQECALGNAGHTCSSLWPLMVGGRGLAWDSGVRPGRGRCSLPPPPPSNSHEWTKTYSLSWCTTPQQDPRTWEGVPREVTRCPEQAYSLEANKVHSGVPQTWGPQTTIPTTRSYLRPLPLGRASPGLAVGPQLGPVWTLNKAVPPSWAWLSG